MTLQTNLVRLSSFQQQNLYLFRRRQRVTYLSVSGSQSRLKRENQYEIWPTKSNLTYGP